MPAIHLLIFALCMCACGLFILFVFLLTFPICIFPSSFFMHLTFSSISYLPEYGMLMFAVFLVKDACLFSSCRFSFSLVMR